MKFYIAPSLLLISLLVGCASAPTDCSGDWNLRGYIAAVNGEKLDAALNEYSKSCGTSTGYTKNVENFNIGYKSGLETFCTPAHAKEFMKRGGQYQGTCSSEMEADFQRTKEAPQ